MTIASIFKTFTLSFCWMFTFTGIIDDVNSAFIDPHYYGLTKGTKYDGCVLLAIVITCMKTRQKAAGVFPQS